MEKTTTIEIAVATRDELKKIGSKGETYDDVIRQLLDLKSANFSKDTGDKIDRAEIAVESRKKHGR